MKFWSGLLLFFCLVSMTWGEPAQIIVLRHAEKPDNEKALHLSPKGQERAQALVKFFTENRKATRYGAPAALYATRPTRRGHGQRPGETLAPLAKELKQTIHMP